MKFSRWTGRIIETPETSPEIDRLVSVRLAEIAAVFSLTESRICQIHAQTILGLRAYLQRVRNR